MKRATLSIFAAFVLGLVPGCSYETLAEHPCPPGGTTLTYQNFGRGFFADYCNRCHSADLDQRNGAPKDYVFSSQKMIQEHRDRIFVRAADGNDSMPPGPDDPPLTERDKLGDWLACGAK